MDVAYDPGKMDRRVLIQQYSETVNYGERLFTFTTYGYRWVGIISNSVDETLQSGSQQISTMTTFRLWYDKNLNEKFRIIYRNRVYNIAGVEEVGRRQFMDVKCEAGDFFPYT